MSGHANAAVSMTVDGPFWEGLAANALRMQRCGQCGTWTWPPQWRCGECGSWEMAWEAVAMTGKVHAFTHTRHAFTAERQGKVPFVNLLVELPQAGGARLLGVLTGPEDGLAIGAPLEGYVVPAGEGAHALPTLCWRLAKEPGQ